MSTPASCPDRTTNTSWRRRTARRRSRRPLRPPVSSPFPDRPRKEPRMLSRRVPLRMKNERGIALVTVLLLTLVIATLAVTAVMLGGNATLVMKYRQRETLLQNAADAGIEEARSAVNGNKTLMPDSGFKAFESNAVIYDAANKPIPNVTRSTYIGPTGITSGEYGVYASAVTVVKDVFGD